MVIAVVMVVMVVTPFLYAAGALSSKNNLAIHDDRRFKSPQDQSLQLTKKLNTLSDVTHELAREQRNAVNIAISQHPKARRAMS